MTGRLRDVEVGGGHDDAVGRDFVARLELDDVTDNEFPDGDGLHLAALATEDGEGLLTAKVLQLHELVVLVAVVPGSDNHLHEESHQNEDSLDPAVLWGYDHARDDADNGHDSHEHQDSVVEGILH